VVGHPGEEAGQGRPRLFRIRLDHSSEGGGIMRRLSIVLLLTLAALLAGPSALAANPEVNHFTFSDSFTDNDFCGTGQTVEITSSGHGTEFFAPNQPVDYRNVIEGNNVFTNPLNDATVIAHFAGPFSERLISGDPEGVHTVEFTNVGLPELFRTEHGGVLSRDAGYIVFHVTFDGDEFISSEIVVNRGPHPQAESDFAIFCDFMTSALGLS
jgi:hypothetical protein